MVHGYGSHTGAMHVHDTGAMRVHDTGSSSVSRVGVNRHRQYREKGAGDRIHYHRDKILMCVSYDFAIAT